MFTGIIEKSATITAIDRSEGGICQLSLECGDDFSTKHGDSVAVNGCCLTVTDNSNNCLTFDVSSETLEITNLKNLSKGSLVNIERAMKLGDRLDGHLVSGHVDGIGQLSSLIKKVDGWELEITIPLDLGKQVIHKGSICLNGVSLTVNNLRDNANSSILSLMLIPTTIELTSFKTIEVDSEINIEVDMIGKFVNRANS
jgi:riboflavin synthase